MKISRLHVNNLKGFTNFDQEFSDVNVVSGPNASNKSSLLCCITALFGKANPLMLRPGCEEGGVSARITSDDGSEYWDIDRTFRPGKVDTPTVRSSESGKIGAPTEFLKSIYDSVSIEPISRAMNASPEEQAKILLDTLPMKLEGIELSEAVGDVDIPGLLAHLKNAARLSGLDAIKNVFDAIYDHRRNVNRDAKTKNTHATELLDSIPKGAAETDWGAKAAALRAELEQQQKLESADRTACERDLAAVKHQILDRKRSNLQEIDSDIDRRTKELENERLDRKRVIEANVTDNLDRIAVAHQGNIDSVTAKYREAIERLRAEEGAASKSASEQAGHDRTLQIAETNRREADALEAKSKAMTAALSRLDALKDRLMERIPIKGLAMDNGVIVLDGVPLSEKNTAERAKFWLKIAAMRAGELGVVCCDGAEAFDSHTMQAVVSACAKTGLQWFFARTDDGEFRIEHIDAD